ncbi:MAG TPA: ribosomal protein S18-alanine N-acetyltransferase [Vicinamibacteria bacterium]|nr:ribosomal protein S18-alanine N-acetyltransferase [Vicinamibacteria bacterium]
MTLPPCFVEAAGSEDVAALAALERRCYTHPWSVRGFRDAMRRGERGLVMVAREGRPGAPERGIVGYCVIETVTDEVHVHNLAVRPESRGGGLGRLLLALGLSAGARRGARVALLEVRESNRPALELYRSMGFAPVALRRNYYSQPSEDALVLRKDGLGAPPDVP